VFESHGLKLLVDDEKLASAWLGIEL